MRDALGNIRLAFVEVKAGLAADEPTVRRGSARRGVDGPFGTTTPSARSSAAWPAAGSVTRRPSLRTTRHHGTSVGAAASRRRRLVTGRGTRRRRRRRRS